jgi:Fe-S-cluster-containing dehydrogenase component
VDAAEMIGADMLEFLTENRFFNGTASMMINLDRCTRCDDCVRACAAAHDGNPRFLRQGPISGKLMVANACMHCVDPVCMIGCPTGAIHRDAFGGQVVINPSTCIGCKACFNNCPYEAIRMVEIRDEQGDILLDREAKPILKATKCDLCLEQITGPACQRACPHGALARVNMHNLDAFANWLKR